MRQIRKGDILVIKDYPGLCDPPTMQYTVIREDERSIRVAELTSSDQLEITIVSEDKPMSTFKGGQ